jgi:hypothetical protein
MSDVEKTFEHQPDNLQRFDLTDMDIPDISHMPAAKNKEQLCIPADEDWEEREIEWIHLSSCPVPTKNGGCCEKDAFRKAKVWSMHGHLSMFSYLMQHLQNSRKHQLSPAAAYDAILASDTREKIKSQCCKYAWQERQIYREYADIKAEAQEQSEDEPKRKKHKKDPARAYDYESGDASDEDFPSHIQDAAEAQAVLSMQGIKLLVAKTEADSPSNEPGLGLCARSQSRRNGNCWWSVRRLCAESAEWAVCTSLISHATSAVDHISQLEAERQNLSTTAPLLSEFTGEKDRTMTATSNTHKSNQLSLSLG